MDTLSLNHPLSTAVQIYTFIIVAYVVLSMLVSFQIVNPRVPIIARVGRILYMLSEPTLRPIRRIVPVIAGFDLSPLVLLLLLQLISRYVLWPLGL
jgi:YggT family protein